MKIKRGENFPVYSFHIIYKWEQRAITHEKYVNRDEIRSCSVTFRTEACYVLSFQYVQA